MQPKKAQPNQRLQQERLSHHWSQQELAARLGTTKVNVSRWERGITSPGPYFRQQLCELFSKTPEELALTPQQDEPCPTANADDDPVQYSRAPQEGTRFEQTQRSSYQKFVPLHFNNFSKRLLMKRRYVILLLLGVSILLIWPGPWKKGMVSPVSGQTKMNLSPSPSTGRLLYTANWRAGFDHWEGPPFWQWNSQGNGMIFTTATVPNHLLVAPTHSFTPPYTVEAQIQRIEYGGPETAGRDYGLVVQMVGKAGYLCGVGVHIQPEHTFLAPLNKVDRPSSPSSQASYYRSDNDLASSPITLDTQWHTYRIDVTESSITCSIDGRTSLSTNMAAFRQAGIVGIFVDHAAIAVRGFRLFIGALSTVKYGE